MDKQRLVSIFNLGIGKKYVQVLVSFIEKFSDMEEIIKEKLAVKNYSACFENLEALGEVLIKIHADDFADEYLKEAETLKKSDGDKIEAFITNYMSRISMLSIDIQMAVFSYQKYDLRSDKGMYMPVDKNSILAVDDVPFFLNNLKAYLRETPYKLTCVNSGDDALQYLQDHYPSLFLLDIEMTRMNGFELAKKIREMGIRTPIIFITGKSSKEWIDRAMEAGAADFITKPINKGLLLSKVDQYMNMNLNVSAEEIGS